MTEVVSSIKRVTDLMGEISAASNEQAAGVGQVGEAVQQMDQVTQQNAALVEQMAAAASSLKTQANELVQVVAVFKLDGGSQSVARSMSSTAHMHAVAAPKPKLTANKPKLMTTNTGVSRPAASKPASLPKPVATAKATSDGDDDWETF
jgi:uncharacterized phage infection (PIP) family protein YhgE